MVRLVCKGCGINIVEDRYRLVAEWAFCHACFDRLGSSGASKRDLAPAPAPAAVAAAIPCCSACERPLDADERQQPGALRVCAACRRSLFADPLRRIQEQEEAERQRERAIDAARAAEPPDEIVPVGMAGKKKCSTCGRRLIEPGGYKLLEGRPFCPACAHAEASRPPPEAARVEAAIAAPDDAPSTCDACERRLGDGPRDAIEGFFFCQPCRSVEREIALFVARARHRTRLLALAAKLADA